MPEPSTYILDTVALRVMAFAQPDGLAILLDALQTTRARFPAEVYNQDEDALELADDDVRLSELARGIRYARRRARRLAPADAERYQSWLRNARQLARYCADHRLIVDPLLPTASPAAFSLDVDLLH